jgi:hypothetical protein
LNGISLFSSHHVHSALCVPNALSGAHGGSRRCACSGSISVGLRRRYRAPRRGRTCVPRWALVAASGRSGKQLFMVHGRKRSRKRRDRLCWLPFPSLTASALFPLVSVSPAKWETPGSFPGLWCACEGGAAAPLPTSAEAARPRPLRRNSTVQR